MRIRQLLLFLLGLCVVLPSAALGDPVFLETKSDSVGSTLLKQKRQIEVYLPSESAKDASGRYETLYVLDGDWNTHIVVEIVSFMRQVGLLPPLIVVGVPNFFDEKGVNSRDRDLTPTVSDEQERSGGAAEFLAYLKTELLPYVDGHYPTNKTHLIHGHSYGGLFLIYALLHEPALFDGYIVLDPALRWDHHALDSTLDEQLPVTPTKGKAIYIAGREGPAFEDMGIASVKPIFESKAPQGLHWKIAAYPAESHDSLKLKATYDALRFAYQGYTGTPLRLVPNGGIVVKGKPVFVTVDGGSLDAFDLRIANDGTTPTEASPKVEPPFAVSDPERTVVRLVSNRGVFDRALPLNLKSGDFMAPPRGLFRPTANWQVEYFAADAWPALRGKPFNATSADNRLSFDDVGRDVFAGRLSRNLDIPVDGYYVLAVFTDKARVALSGKALFEQNSDKGAPYRAFIVPLRRGVYPLRVDFLRAAKSADIEVAVFQVKDAQPEWWKNKLFEVKSEKEH